LSYQKKCKSITFISVKKKYNYSSNDDLYSKNIALVVRKFRKNVFKKNNNDKDLKTQRFFSKKNESENKSKGKTESKEKVKYFECLEYGNLRNEYSNFKRSKKKTLNITLSDEFDSENSNTLFDNKFVLSLFLVLIDVLA
jgi:hypothetical protein